MIRWISLVISASVTLSHDAGASCLCWLERGDVVCNERRFIVRFVPGGDSFIIPPSKFEGPLTAESIKLFDSRRSAEGQIPALVRKFPSVLIRVFMDDMPPQSEKRDIQRKRRNRIENWLTGMGVTTSQVRFEGIKTARSGKNSFLSYGDAWDPDVVELVPQGDVNIVPDLAGLGRPLAGLRGFDEGGCN